MAEPRLIGVTNNLGTWINEGVHNVSMIMVATYMRGEPQLREPENANNGVGVTLSVCLSHALKHAVTVFSFG